jgi:hypothetical protein
MRGRRCGKRIERGIRSERTYTNLRLKFRGVLLFVSVFRDIFVAFLVVGHTHEDVDQRHSVFWRWFNKQDALWSWPHMLERWQSGNHAASLRVLPGVWDFKAWLEPHLNRVQGITKPHLFHLYAGKGESRLKKGTQT